MMARALFVVVAVLAFVSLSYAQTAVCSFVPTTAAVNAGVPFITGTARFTTTGNTVRVDLNVAGLKSNQDYAVHVHQLGDITDLTAGLSVGPHYSAVAGAPHGCPGSSGSNRHTGDMGNWPTDATGTIVSSKSLDLLKLSGSTSIIGRAVVIHSNGDDCVTQDPPGNAGNRLAVCVISYNNLSANQTNSASAAPSSSYSFATCKLRGTLNNCPACSGTVWFNQLSDGVVQINAKIAGLPFGSSHGFHIHQYGDLTDQNSGTSLGVHWNPDGSSHGVPPSEPRHRGDLGSITAYDNEGFAYYQYQTAYVGDLSTLVGRGMVVHQLIDHGSGKNCDATGGSGVRMLTCAIGIAGAYSPALPPGGVIISNNWVNATCGSADRIVYSYALGFTSLLTAIWSLFA